MKVEKNSPLAQMLLKLAAEHDPKLRMTRNCARLSATARLRA